MPGPARGEIPRRSALHEIRRRVERGVHRAARGQLHAVDLRAEAAAVQAGVEHQASVDGAHPGEGERVVEIFAEDGGFGDLASIDVGEAPRETACDIGPVRGVAEANERRNVALVARQDDDAPAAPRVANARDHCAERDAEHRAVLVIEHRVFEQARVQTEVAHAELQRGLADLAEQRRVTDVVDAAHVVAAPLDDRQRRAGQRQASRPLHRQVEADRRAERLEAQALDDAGPDADQPPVVRRDEQRVGALRNDSGEPTDPLRREHERFVETDRQDARPVVDGTRVGDVEERRRGAPLVRFQAGRERDLDQVLDRGSIERQRGAVRFVDETGHESAAVNGLAVRAHVAAWYPMRPVRRDRATRSSRGCFMPWSFVTQHLATILGLALGVLLITRVLGQRESPSVTVAWLLVIVFLPYVGVPFYLLFGTRKMRRVMVRKQPLYVPQRPTSRTITDRYGTDATLRAAGQPPVREGNSIQLAADSTEAWTELMGAIEGAKESIWVCTFILQADDIGRAVVRALAKKAGEGVEVRLLLDGLGCWRTKGRFVAPIRKAGGRVEVFLPVQPLARPWSANLRNHRKSVIVDHRIAFVGGMNIGATYLGPESGLADRWIDTLVRVEGPVVGDISEVFRRDWQFAANEDLDPGPPPAATGLGPARLVANGPDTPDDPLRDILLLSVIGAKRRVWIVTPYFVPDETLLQSLLVTVRQGADVRIILPESSDHLLADLARGHALRTLVQAGARVYLVPGPMVHAKLFLFDDEMAIVGSANFDRRSLYLNHEISLMLCGRREVEAIEAFAEALIADCRPHTPKPGHPLRQFAEDVSGILAPLV